MDKFLQWVRDQGGQVEAGRRLMRSQATISNWIRQGRVAPLSVPHVAERTGIDKAELNPEYFG